VRNEVGTPLGNCLFPPSFTGRKVHNEVSSGGTASRPLAWGDRCNGVAVSGLPCGYLASPACYRDKRIEENCITTSGLLGGTVSPHLRLGRCINEVSSEELSPARCPGEKVHDGLRSPFGLSLADRRVRSGSWVAPPLGSISPRSHGGRSA
jgi:hypothetical protein